jgi:hypothetical protein
MFLVPMYKEMKKIQTGNRQYRNSQASIVEDGNGDEFPDLLFFFGIKNVRVGSVDRKHTHIFFGPV